MNLDEKLKLFDNYLESIDGIPSAIKPDIRLVSRYVLEAATGEPMAETGDDLATAINLPEILQNYGNPDKTAELRDQIDEAIRKISTMEARPDVSTVDTDTAIKLIGQLPDLARIRQDINKDLMSLNNKMNRRMSYAELRDYKLQANAIHERLERLDRSQNDVQRLATVIRQFNQRVLDDNFRNSRINDLKQKGRLLSTTQKTKGVTASPKSSAAQPEQRTVNVGEIIRESIPNAFNEVVSQCASDKEAIYNYMRAQKYFKMNNIPLDQIKTWGPTAQYTQFEINGKKISYVCENGLTIPLRVAYELSLDNPSYKVEFTPDSKYPNTFTILENHVTGDGVISQWAVSFSFDKAEIKIRSTKGSKSKAERVSAFDQQPDELLATGLTQLNELF